MVLKHPCLIGMLQDIALCLSVGVYFERMYLLILPLIKYVLEVRIL